MQQTISPRTQNADEKETYNILKSIEENVLTEPFAPVCDRYYEQRFSTDVNKNPQEDYCLNFHSNKICLLSLAPRHPILSQNKIVKKVNYNVEDDVNRTENVVLGKRKKNAQKLVPESVICYIECEDGSEYRVHSCIKGKLLEINKTLLKEPMLLGQRPRSDGYIALLLPEMKFSNSSFWKDSFLTLEQYNSLSVT